MKDQALHCPIVSNGVGNATCRAKCLLSVCGHCLCHGWGHGRVHSMLRNSWTFLKSEGWVVLINERPGAEAEAVRKEHKWRHTCLFRLCPTHHHKCLLSACYMCRHCAGCPGWTLVNTSVKDTCPHGVYILVTH